MNLRISSQPPAARARSAALAALLVVVLAGCADSAPEPAREVAGAGPGGTEVDAAAGTTDDAAPSGATPGVAGPAPETQAPDADELSFPNCEVVERQVGTGLEALELASEEEHAAQGPMDSSTKTCVWLTELPDDLRGADTDTLMHAAHTGVLTMSIHVAPQPLSQEDAAAANFHLHDLRAERVGGYVFAPADTDLSEPLGLMGVTVTVDRVDVTWGGGTYFDSQGDEIAESFDKDWGIDAAVTVHQLISE